MHNFLYVSKKVALPEGYIPNDLIEIESKYKNGIKLDKTAYYKWQELKRAASLKGYDIEVESGYRSHTYQDKIMKELIAEKGEEYASKAVALPGHSEHQTGLAIDYTICQNGKFLIEDDFDENCDECRYVSSVAHNYGFIIRYPKGKEEITGYKYEPWHLRYVGEELATYLYDNKMTLDEYYKEK